MTELYNEDVKNEFLNSYENQGTRDTIGALFTHSAATEEILDKDLYEFSLEEIKDLITDIRPSTNNTAQAFARFVGYYIHWARENGYINSIGNIDPLEGVNVKIFNDCVDKTKKTLFTEDEIINMEEGLVNAQDSVIIRLLFEGVEGTGLSELLNLTGTDRDIMFDGALRLYDDKKGERYFKPSERCSRFINAALNELNYQTKNGEGIRITEIPLVNNEYVIKTVDKKVVNFGRADKHLVYRRLDNVGKIFDYPYLTAKNIAKSGMLAMARDLYVEHKELEKEQLLEIAEKFNASKINYNGNMEYNLTPIKSFITIENLQELYPEVFE